MSEKKIAMIGLDSSHSVCFTNLIQGSAPTGGRVEGMRVAKALRFPSAFQSEAGQDKRQSELEALGVEIMPDVKSALQGMDAVFLEINDPRLHLEYFEKVASAGLPVFIDKPLADSVSNGVHMLEIAEKHNLMAWCSSPLRFLPQLVSAKHNVTSPTLSQTFGALGTAPAGNDLIWYGVHAVEMMTATLGVGAQTVQAIETGCGIVMAIAYADGRHGLVECLRGSSRYGGRLQSEKGLVMYNDENQSPYPGLIQALTAFVVEGKVPVPLVESLEILAILEASVRSLSSGLREAIVH